MESRWQKCWDASPEIFTLLKESDTLEGAREKIIHHLEALDWTYRRDVVEIKSWDYIILKEAVRCLKNIISPRNERLAESSALEFLWKAAKEGESDASDDFIMEFMHLFKAIKGQAEIYPSSLMGGIEYPDFDKYKGREAGKMRSDFLDIMGRQMEKYLSRYPTGLNPDIVKRRIEKKNRIFEIFNANQDDWDDWKWQFRHVFKKQEHIENIKKVINLTPNEEKAISLAIENGVPFGVTPHYLHLMDVKPNSYDYAVRRQVFPPLSYVENMIAHKEDRETAFDFMREHDTSPIDLVTRRYPKVAIIKPYDSCPQICVYCQRNWEITSPLMESAEASKGTLDEALDWFSQHEQMMDLLVTGGDPLVMSDNKIEYIVKRLSEMPHIRSIRIATRIPITVPQRITKELCEIFGNYYEVGKQTLCVVTHFSHPYEVTLDTAKAISRIKKQGMHVYNQQVYSFAGSRRFETVALRIAIKQIGVDPYYAFNMKGKSEIEDYAVPVARILQERKEEARLLPGIFRSDEPVFNVPFLGKNHLRAWQDHELISILPDGRRVFSFHPWEKNINKVKPYLYVDVPINTYLEKLEKRGENIQDYKSIWYYY
ncbi:MAG: KamA family radical SAM protein [Candidatus Altiarchaeales archaeon WOR_SM1_79]|nr:MAG: KamA family radical SAM protein [Candidatus Altiarchaeales archaeon WOR_SM1_79]